MNKYFKFIITTLTYLIICTLFSCYFFNAGVFNNPPRKKVGNKIIIGKGNDCKIYLKQGLDTICYTKSYWHSKRQKSKDGIYFSMNKSGFKTSDFSIIENVNNGISVIKYDSFGNKLIEKTYYKNEAIGIYLVFSSSNCYSDIEKLSYICKYKEKLGKNGYRHDRFYQYQLKEVKLKEIQIQNKQIHSLKIDSIASECNFYTVRKQDTIYYSRSKKNKSIKVKDGYLHQECKGIIIKKVKYEKGKANGNCYSFYKNTGNLEWEGVCYNGKKNGLFIVYEDSINMELKQIERYWKGELYSISVLCDTVHPKFGLMMDVFRNNYNKEK